MRALLVRLVVVNVWALTCAGATAQMVATHIQDEQSTYGGKNFLSQPAGSVGLVPNGCRASAHLTGTRAYLVKSTTIYWGVTSDCVRVVVNHLRVVEGPALPTYLGVQIVGLYDHAQDLSVVLRRKG